MQNHDNPKLQAYYKRGPTDRTMQVVELYNSGLSVLEVAEKTNRPVRGIYSALARARYRGIKVRPTRSWNKSSRSAILKNIPRGGMPLMFERLSDEVLRWLADSLPPGLTVAEFVASIVTDAYHDEVGN